MWLFKKRMTKSQEENEPDVQKIIAYATAARIEDTRDPHVQMSLMQLRIWGFNAEVDRILPRLPKEARGSLGPVDFFLLPLSHSPSSALASRAIGARSEALSDDQVKRLQEALVQWSNASTSTEIPGPSTENGSLISDPTAAINEALRMVFQAHSHDELNRVLACNSKCPKCGHVFLAGDGWSRFTFTLSCPSCRATLFSPKDAAHPTTQE